MARVELKAAQPNIGKLLKEKRIKVDENGDVVGNPKNPVGGDGHGDTIKRRITMPNPQTGALEQRLVELPRNAGHARGPDDLWRVAMHKKVMYVGKYRLEANSPAEMYHKMTQLYEDLRKMKASHDDFRPELEPIELADYQAWLKKQEKKKAE